MMEWPLVWTFESLPNGKQYGGQQQGTGMGHEQPKGEATWWQAQVSVAMVMQNHLSEAEGCPQLTLSYHSVWLLCSVMPAPDWTCTRVLWPKHGGHPSSSCGMPCWF